jgi:hypothetical protein
MPRPLFAYGSLIVPDVLVSLLGRLPESEAAELGGWQARCLRGVPYPGLVADPIASAPGLLVHGLARHERALIDEWESDVYDKVVVRPRVAASAAFVEADAYVLHDPSHVDPARSDPWTVSILEPVLEAYCRETRAFRAARRGAQRQDSPS